MMLVQEWLQRHGPFDAVVDGANVGLAYQRNFSFSQVKSEIQQVNYLYVRGTNADWIIECAFYIMFKNMDYIHICLFCFW